jgi:hypothetical protein
MTRGSSGRVVNGGVTRLSNRGKIRSFPAGFKPGNRHERLAYEAWKRRRGVDEPSEAARDQVRGVTHEDRDA